MFVNDDGLQLIDEEERRARIDFYADHSIGWTARPRHGVEGFLRRGKFKKVRMSKILPLLHINVAPITQAIFQATVLLHLRRSSPVRNTRIRS